jgi:hypothetical protein
MTRDTDNTHSPPHRRTFEASGDDIEVRQDEESVFELRMPIASTGKVRNEGDDPLTRDEIGGMARQINDGSLTVGVFVDHGQTNISGAARYSIAERVGEWQDAEVTTRDDRDAELLEATARMMDPDSLPDIPVRGHLGTVKELAVRDMSVPASIGWGDDGDAPGGVDLMEASVVGIQADKRTHSEASAGEVVARAAVDAGADPDLLVEQVKAATRNLDDPQFSEGDKVQWTWDDTPVHGRVAGIHEEFTPPEADDPITGDEGEAVYSIHEYDEDTEELSDTANVAKPESSLSPSDVEMPTLDSTNSMTEQNPSEESDTTEEQTADDGDTEQRGMEEEMREMREQMEENTTMTREMHEQMMGGDENAGDDGMDEDEEDEDEDEQSVDTDPTDADTDRDALKEEIEDLREELDAVREGGVTDEDVNVPGDDDDGPDDEQDADENSTDDHAEDGAKSLIR